MSEVAQAPHSSPDGRIPQLRFPEFDGVWESRLLKDAVKINPRSGELPDEFIYIDLESVKKGYLIKETQINKIGAPSRAQRLLNKNDVIFQTVRPYQKNNYFFNLDGDYVASTGYAQLRVLNSPEFLYQALHTDRFVYDVMARSTGTSYPAINSTDLSKIKLNLPTKPEQQKIAAFLTAVDNKIEQLSKKQELLGEYKKGLTQQIFSQAIRFKADDGSDFPDWEEVKLGNIGEFKTSSVDKKIVEGQKLIQLVNYMNVYKHENIKNNSTKDLMIVSANETQLNASDLKKGDILFTPSSETPDDIGHSVVIFEDLMDTLYSYHLMRFRPKVQLDILYSHYFCNIPDVLRQISRVATGSTRFTISVGEFSKIQINLPSLLEQTKIANFLSSIDTKIEQVGKQLDESKQFKKALLQQMFV